MSETDSHSNDQGDFSSSKERMNGSRGINISQNEGNYSMNSTRSEGNTTGKKTKKKKKTPQSIEEIFDQISSVTSSNLNPPPARIILTPRSAEVCLKFGVNPEVLKVRDIDSFWESGIDPSVQRLRHEAYSQRRYDLTKQCRAERKKLVNLELNSSHNASLVSTSVSTETVMKQQQDAINATAIETEKMRLEKLRRRQEKEIEQMLQFEVTRIKSQQEIEKRVELAKQQEAVRQKQQEKRLKLVAEERRLKELQRLAMAEAEEAHARELAKQINERERTVAREQARKIEEQRAKMREEEEEKKRKYEEHKLQVQKFFAEQQAALNERLELMDLREKAKEKEMLEKQEQKRAELAERRQEIEERIERNIKAAELMEKRRKDEYLQRQQEFEENRQRQHDRLEHERRLKAEELRLQEQRRRIIVIQQKQAEERKKEELIDKFEEQEEHVKEVQEMRAKEVEVMRERQNLRMQMKAENVNRVKRVHEYSAMKVMKRIETQEQRTDRLMREKQQLIEQRKRGAAEARLQKEKMIKAMDLLRTDAAEADKVIKKVLTGKASLNDLVGGGSKTADATKKRKKTKKNMSTSELLGLSRTSQSAGNDSDIDMHSSLQKSRGADIGSAPLPYVSPYESSLLA